MSDIKELGITLKHVGINCKDEKEAAETAEKLCAVFGLDYKPGNSSIFSGKEFELMKAPGLGKNGHIAIGVDDMKKAISYFESKGIAFNEGSRKTDSEGNAKAIYFEEEIAGFAFHLVCN